MRELQVEVLLELDRMRDLGDLHALGAFGLDQVPDQGLGEDAALGQIVVVGLQSVQRVLQTGGELVQLGLLFLGENLITGQLTS